MATERDPDLPPAVLALDRRARLRLLLATVLRILAISVALLVTYFAVPVGQDADAVGLAFLVVGSIAAVALLAHEITRIVNSPAPQLRAAETLAVIVPLVVVVFAGVYVAMATADPAAFSEPMDKVDGLYFAVTTLSTTGFGDITGVSEAARLAVTVQMLVDLLIIGVVVKVIIGASRVGLARARRAVDDGPHPPG